MSPSGNGREGESGLKNDAVPSQTWSSPHEWMNNEQQPLCAMHMHLCVCVCAHIWSDCVCCWWRSKMRGEVFSIVPKCMQSIYWRQCLLVSGYVRICVCVFVWTWICEFNTRRKASWRSHINGKKRALCVFFPSQGETLPPKSDHFVTNSVISLQSLLQVATSKKVREPFFFFYRRYCKLTKCSPT